MKLLRIIFSIISLMLMPVVYVAAQTVSDQTAPPQQINSQPAEVLDKSAIDIRDLSVNMKGAGDATWQTTSRQPASVVPENMSRPGEVNGGLDPSQKYIPIKKIDYVLEVRDNPRKGSVPVRIGTYPHSKKEFDMQPGQMVRISDTEADYLLKMQMERRGQTAWKRLNVHGYEESDQLFFEYHYQDFETISPYHLPVELQLNIPAPFKSMMVYREPGLWDSGACDRVERLCVAEVDQHAEVYLADTLWLNIDNRMRRTKEWHLFYQVGFKYRQPDGNVNAGFGWIHSSAAQRKITKLQNDLFISRMPAAEQFKSVEQEKQDISKIFIFKKNYEALDLKENRFLKNKDPEQVRKLASIYDILLAWDWSVAGSYYSMQQSNVPVVLNQVGFTPKLQVSAPMFVDLELSGSIAYTIPYKSGPDNYTTPGVWKMEQWLTYISPWKMSGHPLRLAGGFYYITMNHAYLGFNSLLGAQGKVTWETDSGYFFGRMGPLGSALTFTLANREIGAGAGLFLDTQKRQDSWTIFTEYSNIDYTHTNGLNIKYQQIQLGIQNSF